MHAMIAELKRRRVFRALIAWAVLSFAVLQIIEPIMHGLHWPDVVLSYVVAALGAGVPMAAGAAWMTGTDEEAIGGPRGIRMALLLVAIGAIAAAPGLFWYFARGARHEEAAPAAMAGNASI